MAKEKGLKHKEILKCMRCREDKQKCVPFPRSWPGTKCNRCDEHGYQCSKPLSARNERIIREEALAKEDFSEHSSDASEDGAEMAIRDDETAVVVTQSPTTGYTMRFAHIPPVEVLLPMEPSFYRPVDETSGRLMQRLLLFWATPSTFHSSCDPGLAHAICDFFWQDTRQISLLDDMVHHAVLAFTAGDASLNQLALNSRAFRNLTHQHATKATAMLFEKLDKAWPTLNDATIISAAFHLLLYGVCVSDLAILSSMAAVIQEYHAHNTGFPISAMVVPRENGGWTVRIYQTRDPDLPGLIMHNHTNTFMRKRLEFDQSTCGGSAISFTTVINGAHYS